MSIFSRFFNIFIGVIFIIFGVYLWVNPIETLLAYSFYLGITHIAVSVVALSFFLIRKIKPVPWGSIIVSFIIGLIILLLPIMSLTVILWLFIFSFLIASIYSFMKARENRTYHTLQITLSILAIIYGVVMLVRPMVGVNTLGKIIAAFIILNGVSYIFPPYRY